MDQKHIQLIYNGLSGRYSREKTQDQSIRIVVISVEEEAVDNWDSDKFNHYTGQILTKELVDTSYVEIDSTTNPQKIEIKLIPEILLN